MPGVNRRGLDRRELLHGLGIAGASTLLSAFGCGGRPHRVLAPGVDPGVDRDEVRSWLRDAVARLVAVYPSASALAVERRRTLAVSDVLGAGISRTRRDGVVLQVRDARGWRESVVASLTRNDIDRAVRALVPETTNPTPVEFGPVPTEPPVPAPYSEQEIRNRVEAITRKRIDSRIVYGVSMFDVEDAHVWWIAPNHDLEQRAFRVRERVARAAWNGSKPVVAEIERGWTGAIVDKARQLGEDDADEATRRALEVMTPATFPDGRYVVLLDPSVTASMLDSGTRALLTTVAARRPELESRLVFGTPVASPAVTLIDDPTARHAYGGFAFDDEGTPATAITLIDHGRLAGILGDRATGSQGRGRRPGHVGAIEPAPSHLRLLPGIDPHTAMHDDGFLIEGGSGAIVDPATSRVVIAAARAREIRGGKPTGRVYADVELVGDLGAMLTATTAVSSDTTEFVYRDEIEDEPRWRSVEAPWLRVDLTKPAQPGFVRARRSA